MKDVIETFEPVSAEEIAQAVSTLAKFKPGFLPFTLFCEVARLTVSAIVEVVPCRLSDDGRVEVLLLQRDPEDPLWPSMWHNPGTVIRPNDTPYTFDEAFVRICKDELGLEEVILPTYVKDIVHPTRRGMDMARVYFLELDDAPRGTFVDVAALPSTIITANAEVIRLAAEAFAQYKQEGKLTGQLNAQLQI